MQQSSVRCTKVNLELKSFEHYRKTGNTALLQGFAIQSVPFTKGVIHDLMNPHLEADIYFDIRFMYISHLPLTFMFLLKNV